MWHPAWIVAWCVAGLVAQRGPDPARDFFARGSIVRVNLTLAPEAREALRKEARQYVAAQLSIDGDPYAGVGVKLKGSAGSFRNMDERPGFTVNLRKFGGNGELHGKTKFHLNNGAQDGSRLHEWLGAEVFAAAGYPAPRVAHARLFLDGQDLGLYVLREAFDEAFLARCFPEQVGNLYDGGFCRDLNEDLDRDGGAGCDDCSDLHRLRALCTAFDASQSVRLEHALDMARFADFCALEALLGHWDGYSRNRNNYRLWLPTNGQALFLPHGMDQLLGDADADILEHPSGMAASAMMQVPALRKQYRESLKALLPKLAAANLPRRIEALGAKLERELKRDQPDAAAALQEAVRGLLQRLRARCQFLQKEVQAPEPKPLDLAAGKSVVLRKWLPGAHTDGVEAEKQTFAGVACWQAQARGNRARVHAGFQQRVLLSKGRYQLTAKTRTDRVVAAQPDAAGAFLAVDGARSQVLTGDNLWQDLSCEFSVAEFQRSVPLALEFQARGGRVWFRADSITLRRIE